MRPQDTVPKPDFEIPDLTEEQQAASGLPADFWTAFDEYFDGLTEADDPVQAQKTLAEIVCIDAEAFLFNPADHSYRDEGWEVTDVYRGVLLTYRGKSFIGGEIMTDGEEAMKAARVLYNCESTAEDPFQVLEQIRAGQRPVWAFLPAAREQLIERNRWSEANTDEAVLLSNRDQLISASVFAVWSGVNPGIYCRQLGISDQSAEQIGEKVRAGTERLSALGGIRALAGIERELEQRKTNRRRAQYALGWPGEGQPPEEES